MANSNGKFALGLFVGAFVGAAIAYLSDRDKRERLSDDLSCTFDKAKDGLVEGYYEAKERYQNYRDKLSNRTEQLLEEVRDELKEID